MKTQTVRLVLLIGVSAMISSCGMMPTSGPSRRQVAEADQKGFEIVDVTDAVARQLLDSRKRTLFSEFPPAAGSSETVGSGDVLEVYVWEAPPAALFGASTGATGKTSSVTAFPDQMVNSDGNIYVPFAGEIAAAGKKLQDIEAEIAQQLSGKANQPQVLVRRVTNNTAYVTVVGEVMSSMRMPLTPRGERLLDALAAAGGTKQPVNKVALQLTRGTTVRSLPLDSVIRDPQQNILLQPGDVVTVLFQPLSFTALGATSHSEEVYFETQGISLAQALGRVGGVMDDRANPRGVFVFRLESRDTLPWPNPPVTTPDGRVPVVYRVDLKDPRSFFVAQNFLIENKDVLYVSNAPVAEFQKFLNLLVSTIYPIEGAVVINHY
jgi:polysaccharide biosynthesis/export protein